MNQEWQYQLRIYMNDDVAAVARQRPDDPTIKPLADILVHAKPREGNDAAAQTTRTDAEGEFSFIPAANGVLPVNSAAREGEQIEEAA